MTRFTGNYVCYETGDGGRDNANLLTGGRMPPDRQDRLCGWDPANRPTEVGGLTSGTAPILWDDGAPQSP